MREVVAMDCEMVGVGPCGTRSILARVSLVDSDGDVLLDTFVAPTEHVTAYRTPVSGVRPSDLVGAPSFQQVQREVQELLQGKVLVGHSVDHDLEMLHLHHPDHLLRDTAKYRPLMYYKNGEWRPHSLKRLAGERLGLSIQQGAHDSVDDARAALALYHKYATRWERAVAHY